MNMNQLFEDKKLLENKYSFFLKKGMIVKIENNKELVAAHLDKAKHNLLFFEKNVAGVSLISWTGYLFLAMFCKTPADNHWQTYNPIH